MLRVEDVHVRFGGVVALDGVTLDVPQGRVTGLIGPNGAGKTTLFNVVTGLQRPTRGTVRLGSRDITRARVRSRSRAGLGRTFQRLEVFGSLTVRENVLLAAELHQRRGASTLADQLVARVGLSPLAHQPAGALPTGTARLLELARALATRPTVLLLDEPGSGLDEREATELGALLVTLAEDGTGVLLVEHDVELVMSICQHVYVLDVGTVLAEGTPAQVQADSRVQAAYLGAEPSRA